MNISLCNLGFLSPNSRSYSFDHRANGYARGEGIGVVIIKRVADAIRDNDTIRAVIRSTGTNQDGHTPGITLPNADSQKDLIVETYRKANLDMGITNFVESHGACPRRLIPINPSFLFSYMEKRYRNTCRRSFGSTGHRKCFPISAARKGTIIYVS